MSAPAPKFPPCATRGHVRGVNTGRLPEQLLCAHASRRRLPAESRDQHYSPAHQQRPGKGSADALPCASSPSRQLTHRSSTVGKRAASPCTSSGLLLPTNPHLQRRPFEVD